MKSKRSSANVATIPSSAPTSMGMDAGYLNKGVAKERLGQPDAQQTSVTETLINAAAVYLYRQARWQPISLLTPEVLTSQLAEWNIGAFRRFSLTMDAVENRDLIVKAATGKLKMALARRNYEIVKVEGADESEADAHADALQYFYANCSATSAVDRNIRGGFSRLVQFIMDAALKRYSPFEIIWQPRGEMLTATFVHVPLWFFENRTGVLRFCGNFAWDGIPLKDGQWMVACGEGIMESIVVAAMYKLLAFRDWLIYSERNGMPVPYCRTPHANGSKGWDAIVEALTNLGPLKAAIVGMQDEIGKLDFGSAGQLPYPIMVEYFDRAIVALARGADLSTLSAHSSSGGSEGQGASVQGDESDLVEQHYGAMVSETLNHYVDPWVLKWHFGEDVVPAAYCKLDVPTKKDTQMDLQVDEKLIGWGVELGIENALERYGRVEAGEGDRLLENQQQQFDQELAQQQMQFQGNSRLTRPQAARLSRMFLGQTHRRLCRQACNAVQPLKNRIASLLEMKDDKDFAAALKGLRSDLPKIRLGVDRISQRELEGVLEVNGV